MDDTVQVVDLESRAAYYGAGIMLWMQQHRRSHFTKADLAFWNDTSPLDQNSEFYLTDQALLDEALGVLQQLGAILRVDDKYGPTVYTRQSAGLSDFAELFQDSPFFRANAFGSDWMKAALVAVTKDKGDTVDTPTVSIQVSEDGEIWEPLPLDRSPEAQQAVAAVRSAIDDVASDNGLSATFPSERDNILTFAEATLSVIKEGRVTREQIRHNIVGAGKWLSRMFPDTVLGELGEKLTTEGEALLAFLSIS